MKQTKNQEQNDKNEGIIGVKFDVWRKFYPPFKCICCGKIISLKQFRFSCLCPYCDLGKCGSRLLGNLEEGHGLDLWKKAEKLGDEFQEIVKEKLKEIKNE